MRSLWVAMMIAATPAAACNSELISVQDDWSAENQRADDGTVITKISFAYKYVGERPYRMISGSVSFSDTLGKAIAVLPLNRDDGLSSGKTSSVSVSSYGPDLPRLAKLNRSDVVISTCVRAVIYADGTKEEFK